MVKGKLVNWSNVGLVLVGGVFGYILGLVSAFIFNHNNGQVASLLTLVVATVTIFSMATVAVLGIKFISSRD